MKFALSKKYVTREGIQVHILSISGRRPFVVVGYQEEDIKPSSWTADGSHSNSGAPSAFDIVDEWKEPEEPELNEPRKAYIAIDGSVFFFTDADIKEYGYEWVTRAPHLDFPEDKS